MKKISACLEELSSKKNSFSIDLRERLESVLNEYKEKFGDQEVVIASSPGRLEIIGNFQDNGLGHTLSVASHIDDLIVLGKGNGKIHIVSKGFGELQMYLNELPDPDNCTKSGWTPYSIGIAKQLADLFGDRFKGYNAVIDGRVPGGSGISSSAAFEVAQVFATNLAYRLNMDVHKMASVSKRAENEWKGKGCGFLDQMTTILGFVYLDYSNAEAPLYEQINVPWFKDSSLVTVVVDKGHSGRDQDYNQIRKDLGYVAGELGLGKIMRGDHASYKQFEKRFGKDPSGWIGRTDETALKRGLFFCQEYERVEKAKLALMNGDSALFGRYMDESGDGSRILLGNTTKEIDHATDIARKFGGNARVHGGGFGGSILIKTNEPEKIVKIFSELYGRENVIEHIPGRGVYEIKL